MQLNYLPTSAPSDLQLLCIWLWLPNCWPKGNRSLLDHGFSPGPVFDCRSMTDGWNNIFSCLHLHVSIVELLIECLTKLWPNLNRSVLHLNITFHSSIFNRQFGCFGFFFTWLFINLIPLMIYICSNGCV